MVQGHVGTEATVLIKAARVELADSALHAPSAAFGDDDFYPDLADKAAVLTCRLSWNLGFPRNAARGASRRRSRQQHRSAALIQHRGPTVPPIRSLLNGTTAAQSAVDAQPLAQTCTRLQR